MMTAPVVIGVFGISGVGKSWLVSEVASRIPSCLHLQGSALIKQGLADPSVSSEELRCSGSNRIVANQRILVAMFDRALSEHTGGLVLFDGHLLVDTEAELIEVPQTVIGALHPAVLIHVEAEPLLIAARRQADSTRIRPTQDIAALATHQIRSRHLCKACARGQGIPMHIVRSGHVDGFTAICQ